MNTADTHPAPPKEDPDELALRASPRPVTRLNRRMLAVLSGALGAAVLATTLWSLQTHRRTQNTDAELFNVERVSHAENLDQLPRDYSKVVKEQVPVLGAPLPGDLGPAIVHVEHDVSAGPSAPTAPAGRVTQSNDSADAAHSSVFFHTSRVAGAASTASPAATPEPASGSQGFNPTALTAASAQTGDPTILQNRQDQKQAFWQAQATARCVIRRACKCPARPIR